jgi:hypothetical protein
MEAKVTATLAVVLAALLVAGCGGGGRLSKAEYQQKIQAEGKTAQQALTKLSKVTSLSALAQQVGAVEKAVERVADDLDGLKPPQDVEDDNATIVTALRTIDGLLKELRKAATSGDLGAAAKAGTAVQNTPEVKAAEQAIKDLKAKGYDVGIFGS